MVPLEPGHESAVGRDVGRTARAPTLLVVLADRDDVDEVEFEDVEFWGPWHVPNPPLHPVPQ
jgi:hypothetical protein